MRTNHRILCAVVVAVASLAMSEQVVLAHDANWDVAKSSGETWISHANAQPVSLTNEMVVRPGDTIRTGDNGRLLLTRGDKSILVSANSVIEIPTSNHDGMSTTIMERAGSILLEVEKRKVKHFEVVTPYLAAVVKGTHFRVSMDDAGSHVDVLRGQVDVVDYKSGDEALVLPGQTAQVAATGSTGLRLSGSGSFNPITKGPARRSPVSPASPVKRSASAESHQNSVGLRSGRAGFHRRMARSKDVGRRFGSSLRYCRSHKRRRPGFSFQFEHPHQHRLHDHRGRGGASDPQEVQAAREKAVKRGGAAPAPGHQLRSTFDCRSG